MIIKHLRQQPQQLRWQQRRRQSQSLTIFDADNDDDSGQLLRCGDCEKKLQCEKIDSFSSIDNDNFSGVASRLRRRSGVARLMAEKASIFCSYLVTPYLSLWLLLMSNRPLCSHVVANSYGRISCKIRCKQATVWRRIRVSVGADATVLIRSHPSPYVS
ncbi:hypothetical protein DY000_02032389 [Brassica cretica]|uniref:Uncharacterized protein n=1 Tax=Brassica cretica TaxID=69181 RepID=A0ABQ7DG45_BRACR|nr:hypothetical protein DY000_02032389 [Brassica cretica]